MCDLLGRNRIPKIRFRPFLFRTPTDWSFLGAMVLGASSVKPHDPEHACSDLLRSSGFECAGLRDENLTHLGKIDVRSGRDLRACTAVSILMDVSVLERE